MRGSPSNTDPDGEVEGAAWGVVIRRAPPTTGGLRRSGHAEETAGASGPHSMLWVPGARHRPRPRLSKPASRALRGSQWAMARVPTRCVILGLLGGEGAGAARTPAERVEQKVWEPVRLPVRLAVLADRVAQAR